MKRSTLTAQSLKEALPSSDILTFPFASVHGKKFCAVFLDGVVDKALLGELAVKPLQTVPSNATLKDVQNLLATAELQVGTSQDQAVSAVLNGTVALFVEEEGFFLLGLKAPPGRAVAEPPTSIVVKGPREGFTEDIKVNAGLIRKRIKCPELMVEPLKLGTRTQTDIAVWYLKGVAKEEVVGEVKRRLQGFEVDGVIDSSLIGKVLSGGSLSLFKHYASCEKPDIFCAKLCEGRVGILVDGSPMALTLPYLVVEDFQSPEDYFISHHRATVVRFIRLFSVLIGILLPALYIAAQLFKIQLIPYKLLTKISSSVSGIPLSPSIEMFLTLLLLEVLNEASIRMPKYVGLTLSVVGALVLGDTAVKAGVISTPAIIIVAFSAICLYTVPDLVETSSMLRWLYLLVAGSVGTFGIVLLTAFLLCYLVEERSFGVPLLAPFAPLVPHDLKDGFYKSAFFDLATRPKTFRLKNQTRLRWSDHL